LHGLDLQQDTVEVFHGNRDFAQSYISARNRLFPNAASGPVSTEGATFEGDKAEVWYCPACREAESAWKAKRV
jgi:hypothetical protein